MPPKHAATPAVVSPEVAAGDDELYAGLQLAAPDPPELDMTAPDSLSEEQLLQRRLQHIRELQALYTRQYFDLLEETHLRQHSSKGQPTPGQRRAQRAAKRRRSAEQQQEPGQQATQPGSLADEHDAEQSVSASGSSSETADTTTTERLSSKRPHAAPAAPESRGSPKGQRRRSAAAVRLVKRESRDSPKLRASGAGTAAASTEQATAKRDQDDAAALDQGRQDSPTARGTPAKATSKRGRAAQPATSNAQQAAPGKAGRTADKAVDGSQQQQRQAATLQELWQEQRGTVKDDDSRLQVPSYVEAMQLLAGAAALQPALSQEELCRRRNAFRRGLRRLERLEQSSAAAAARELDARSALAMLSGRRCCFFVKRVAVTLGRSAVSSGEVDIDLAEEADARRVCRRQAELSLQADGTWRLCNVGRRRVLINGRALGRFDATPLQHLSLLDIGGIQLLFSINLLAVRRLRNRSASMAA